MVFSLCWVFTCISQMYRAYASSLTMSAPAKVTLVTGNKKKLEEFKKILGPNFTDKVYVIDIVKLHLSRPHLSGLFTYPDTHVWEQIIIIFRESD